MLELALKYFVCVFLFITIFAFQIVLNKFCTTYFTQMFKGNSGADSIKFNVFEVPIIAQWVRINPTRWRDRISLRAELYGCEYSM